ncbi:hypothetical protein GALMADRAFT_51524 [Galerina marginata CBS 339.88]|uniref:Pal1 cell morphology protein n=1 Tax=Galerina marginata (strain CBS 339.88) TaxID=685588 RepID=A0A067U0Q7_GALM3|nr:hypothetical protein GALMADRAFT_51524 [Galerina marginata CBS 339.88]
MPAAVPSSRNSSQHDITEAVRDTVTVRAVDSSSRAKINRAQTTLPQGAVSTSSRPPGKRSQSEDSANIVEKPRSSGKSRSKKGSQHADVIDRLDFTGVGPMFHHDGPFDACAPSRNKHRNKAPLYSWGTEETPAPTYGDSAYPSAHAYKAFTNDYPEPPKRKVDAIAEAWGIHEPEPFEEFFAGGGSGRPDGDTPASSIYNGKDAHSGPRSAPAASTTNPPRRSKDAPRESRDETRPRIAARRSLVPPPQPIFVGEPADMDPAGSPPASSPGFPKRSKSIMHRIRKMRDAPNVPAGPDYDQHPPASPSSPTEPMHSARPTHRPQNSFLGRFGGNNRANHAPTPAAEPFVFIETGNSKEKDLPAPPPVSEAQAVPEDYFDGHASSGGGGGGLGRKTSLMKKVGRVVRGTK